MADEVKSSLIAQLCSIGCVTERWAQFALETAEPPWDLEAAVHMVVTGEFNRMAQSSESDENLPPTLTPSPPQTTTRSKLSKAFSMIDKAIEESLKSGLSVEEENQRIHDLIEATGLAPNAAREVLEANEWHVQRAANLYLPDLLYLSPEQARRAAALAAAENRIKEEEQTRLKEKARLEELEEEKRRKEQARLEELEEEKRRKEQARLEELEEEKRRKEQARLEELEEEKRRKEQARLEEEEESRPQQVRLQSEARLLKEDFSEQEQAPSPIDRPTFDMSDDEATRLLAIAAQHRANLDNERKNAQKIAKVRSSIEEENRRRQLKGIPLLKEHQQHQVASNSITSPLKKVHTSSSSSLSVRDVGGGGGSGGGGGGNGSRRSQSNKKRITKVINGVEYERVGGGWAPLNETSLLWQSRDQERIRKKLDKQKAALLFDELMPSSSTISVNKKTSTLPYIAVNSNGRTISVTDETYECKTMKHGKVKCAQRSKSASSAVPSSTSTMAMMNENYHENGRMQNSYQNSTDKRTSRKSLPPLGNLSGGRNRILRSS